MEAKNVQSIQPEKVSIPCGAFCGHNCAFIGVLMIVIPMAASGVTGIIPIIIPGSVRDA